MSKLNLFTKRGASRAKYKGRPLFPGANLQQLEFNQNGKEIREGINQRTRRFLDNTNIVSAGGSINSNEALKDEDEFYNYIEDITHVLKMASEGQILDNTTLYSLQKVATIINNYISITPQFKKNINTETPKGKIIKEFQDKIKEVMPLIKTMMLDNDLMEAVEMGKGERRGRRS